MNLEDHLGEIVRKAREAANVSSTAAAQAAGLSEAELLSLEQSGCLGKRLQWNPGQRLGVDRRQEWKWTFF